MKNLNDTQTDVDDALDAAPGAYASSPIKRARRSGAEMAKIRDAIYQACQAHQPATVRQIYYQLVSAGVIAKTEQEYKGTVVRLLTDMRRDGELPYGWIADNTRLMRKPTTFDSLSDALATTHEMYRRALWNEQDAYVEIWLEKDALSGVLYAVTARWDVPLMVTRGYPSLTFLHSAAEAITWQKKPAHLFYFGDHDPSGVDIPRTIERELRRMAPNAEIHFKRLAVNEDQIRSLGLPTRPTKKTDSRARNFEGESVEVDAIPPGVLRAMVTNAITQLIDPARLARTRLVEEAERETLASMIRGAA